MTSSPNAVGTATMTGRYDNGHPAPYDPDGPPGQDPPRASRRPVDAVICLWTTPHGLRRLVGPTGTHEVCEPEAWRLEHAEELDALIEEVYRELLARH